MKSARLEKSSGRQNLLLILDSNIYIFALGAIREPSCEKLLEKIVISNAISLRIPRLIIDEVNNNLTPEAFKEFILFINGLTEIDEDNIIPFELGAKYESMGLKAADAFIGAYVEWTGADALVTENRHFLTRQGSLPFKIINAQNCLKFIKSSRL
jgi:uncharacterized protein (DUF2164 family)